MDAKQFLAEFAHIASAPGGIQRLRELIYQLAITGALTQQLESDGDGNSLLHDAKAEKKRLISENAFKNSPKLEAQAIVVPAQTKIPNSWCWCRLVDVGEINPRNEAEDATSASFISMSGVPQLHSGKLEAEQRLWGDIKKGFTHFADGDVVLAKITPCFENGKAAVIRGLVNGIGTGTTELHVVRPLRRFIEPAYVYVFLRSPYFAREGEKHMTGTAGQKRLPTEYFATRAFPLPPLPEQNRIVVKVDELMSLCDKLEAQQQRREKLERLTRKATLERLAASQEGESLLINWSRTAENLGLWCSSQAALDEFKNVLCFLGCRGLLTEPGSHTSHTSGEGMFNLPPRWSWVTLKDLAEYITSGSRGWSQFLAPSGDVFIRSQDIKHDALVFEDKAFVALPEKVEGQRTLVRVGDLLITITGANVGKCAQVPELREKAYVSQHIALVRVRDVHHTPFLHFWITNAFGGRKYLARYIYGDKPGLNLSQVGNIPVPLPPQDAQDRIVAALKRYTAMCRLLGTQINDSRALAGAFARAAVASITGIRVQDSDKMRAPKTELVSALRIGESPTTNDQAPLTAILVKNKGELSAKALWSNSGLEIDAFYQQLKVEMNRGWIVQPEPAYVKEVEVK